MGTALKFDLRHDGVEKNLSHQPDETIASAALCASRIMGQHGNGSRASREVCTGDDLAAGLVSDGLERASGHPATNGVIADSEQPSGFTDPELRHGTHGSTAFAVAIAARRPYLPNANAPLPPGANR
ncbi:hypothetical protein GCM10022381_11970 [Leifsonia kafniensis]|uniref:MmgE/PrpD family protein n=1 Tax=Leifsonia kafniensis TaxID=475957 RepID=A0ABP7KAD8_9MICO